MNCLAASGQNIFARTTKERSYPKERKIMDHTQFNGQNLKPDFGYPKSGFRFLNMPK